MDIVNSRRWALRSLESHKIAAAVAGLREEVVSDPDLIDVGMVFGTGFAPFRGGPMNYAKDRGVDEIISRLEQLAAEHGERFAPDGGWPAIRNWAEEL